MKRVLALAGSPRRGGNSETLLDQVLNGVENAGGEVEKIILNELTITPCQECGGCDKSGLCIIDDDMQMVYPKLDGADIVILAAPIFFSGLTAQTKAMIDRCQCHWIRKFILNKSPHNRQRKGIFVSVRGQAGLSVFHTAAKSVKAMFATEDVEYSKELFVDHIDDKGDVDKDTKSMDAAYMIGYEIVLGTAR